MMLYFVLSSIESLALSHMQTTNYQPLSPGGSVLMNEHEPKDQTQKTKVNLSRNSSRSKKSRKSIK
jgi:hypothetical protein